MVSQRLFKQFIAFCCDKNTELEITTMFKIKHIKHIELFFRPTRKAKKAYSKEPKSVTSMQTLTNQKSRTVSSWLLIGLNLHKRM